MANDVFDTNKNLLRIGYMSLNENGYTYTVSGGFVTTQNLMKCLSSAKILDYLLNKMINHDTDTLKLINKLLDKIIDALLLGVPPDQIIEYLENMIDNETTGEGLTFKDGQTVDSIYVTLLMFLESNNLTEYEDLLNLVARETIEHFANPPLDDDDERELIMCAAIGSPINNFLNRLDPSHPNPITFRFPTATEADGGVVVEYDIMVNIDGDIIPLGHIIDFHCEIDDLVESDNPERTDLTYIILLKFIERLTTSWLENEAKQLSDKRDNSGSGGGSGGGGGGGGGGR